jgi:hypothetical protein
MTWTEHSHKSWSGYAAALWALIFAVLHLVWAAGWYIGLNPERAREAFDKTWFMTYDLVVAGMCLLAVPVALSLVQTWGRRLPRWLIGLFAWGATSLLVLRSAGSIIQTVYLVATERFAPEPQQMWELWFVIGALLFLVSTWRFWRASAPSV